jgi:hypothetical protein
LCYFISARKFQDGQITHNMTWYTQVLEFNTYREMPLAVPNLSFDEEDLVQCEVNTKTAPICIEEYITMFMQRMAMKAPFVRFQKKEDFRFENVKKFQESDQKQMDFIDQVVLRIVEELPMYVWIGQEKVHIFVNVDYIDWVQ